MRIRIWNAFASNNSGSYYIVVTFPSESIATAFSTELAPVIAAHKEWYMSYPHQQPSPLETFAQQHSLTWRHEDEYWLELRNAEILVAGKQAIVEHYGAEPFPGMIGEYIYRIGGRVSTEIDHAHHPIVVVFNVWWPWDSPESKQSQELSQRIVEQLTSSTGVLTTITKAGIEPALRININTDDSFMSFMKVPLTIATVFEDLVLGVDSVQQVLQQYRAQVNIKLFEVWDEEAEDPLAFLREVS